MVEEIVSVRSDDRLDIFLDIPTMLEEDDPVSIDPVRLWPDLRKMLGGWDEPSDEVDVVVVERIGAVGDLGDLARYGSS